MGEVRLMDPVAGVAFCPSSSACSVTRRLDGIDAAGALIACRVLDSIVEVFVFGWCRHPIRA